MSVTFRSKQKYLSISHDTIFRVGVVHAPYKPTEDGKGRVFIGSQEEWEALQKLPDPDMVNNSYIFSEGEEHNQLTLSREDAITGMRAYIEKNCKGVNHGLIVEVE